MTNFCANRCRRRRKEALTRSCPGACASHCTETPYVVSYNTLGQSLSHAVSPPPGPRHPSVQPRFALLRQRLTKPGASYVQANLKQGESKGKAGGDRSPCSPPAFPLLSPCFGYASAWLAPAGGVGSAWAHVSELVWGLGGRMKGLVPGDGLSTQSCGRRLTGAWRNGVGRRGFTGTPLGNRVAPLGGRSVR
jgi:hypothetical protein